MINMLIHTGYNNDYYFLIHQPSQHEIQFTGIVQAWVSRETFGRA